MPCLKVIGDPMHSVTARPAACNIDATQNLMFFSHRGSLFFGSLLLTGRGGWCEWMRVYHHFRCRHHPCSLHACCLPHYSLSQMWLAAPRVGNGNIDIIIACCMKGRHTNIGKSGIVADTRRGETGRSRECHVGLQFQCRIDTDLCTLLHCKSIKPPPFFSTTSGKRCATFPE